MTKMTVRKPKIPVWKSLLIAKLFSIFFEKDIEESSWLKALKNALSSCCLACKCCLWQKCLQSIIIAPESVSKPGTGWTETEESKQQLIQFKGFTFLFCNNL